MPFDAGNSKGCGSFLGNAEDPFHPSCVVIFEYAIDIAEKELQVPKHGANVWRPRLHSDTFQRINCPAFLVTITGAVLR